MKKTINFNGYNVAEIVKRYSSGDCLCNISQVVKTEKTDTTDASEQTVKSDTNIIFMADKLPFELTEKDIAILTPIINQTLTDNKK